jgi:hypothetical protein
MCREDGHRLPRLDDESLVRTQALECGDDLRERLGAASCTSATSVDDQSVRILGNLRVEVVEEATQRAFLLPAAAAELEAAGSSPAKRVDHPPIVTRPLVRR